MDEKDIKESTDEFERALKNSGKNRYLLRLYISGKNPKSQRAVETLRRICTEHLAGKYELEIIDITECPECLEEDRVLAIPTLIKKLPQPLRQFVGDLSNAERILVGLAILPKGPDTPPDRTSSAD